jgi:sugar/nucleoside kinase (ribokinase family)
MKSKNFLLRRNPLAGVIVGNLAIDVRSSIPSATLIANFAPGHDVAATADGVSIVLGGSAWLFAEALMLRHRVQPLIMGCVGNDVPGDFILDRLSTYGLPLTGIDRTSFAQTSAVMLTYLPDGTRLMIRPALQANDYLSPTFVSRILRESDMARYQFVWLSGYALLRPTSDRMRAVKQICNWAHANQRTVIVDLVPHAFRENVGDLEYVSSLLGKMNGVVAELETYCGLGYCQAEVMASAPRHACEQAVRQVSQLAGLAVAQHRIDETRYLQVIGKEGAVVDERVYPVEGSKLRGMGDAMSIEALALLGLLDGHNK